MDFSPDEGQQAVADVVTSALGRENSWEALVGGGIVAFGVPERLGGDGLGLAEVSTASWASTRWIWCGGSGRSIA